ncbi:MAG: RluA family pseudouridine synthase [Acidobacteriota bacterium]|nr:RluA family pseudouridine synthase [Acidobacteriota bacterium]
MSLSVHEWRFEVGSPDHGNRLDTFLARHLDWRSRNRIQDAIRKNCVRILSHKDPQQALIGQLKAGLKLRCGQEVVVRLPAPHAEPEAGSRRWEPEQIPIVFDDDHLLAVNKPPHINVYPSRRHRAGSLIELVHEAHRRRYGSTHYAPTLCHRLDRETSGLVLFAKSRSARAEISRQLEERKVEKTYLALVVGEMPEREGRIDLPLGRDETSAVEIKSVVTESGQPATTRWRIARLLAEHTVLELFPETGRQHQLRAHCAATGHPIVGDKLYLGGDELFLRSLDGPLSDEDIASLGLDRQALHAWRMSFSHPATSAPVTLEAPLWPDMADLISSG